MNLPISSEYCIIDTYFRVLFGGMSVKICIIEDFAAANHAITAALSDCLCEIGYHDFVEIDSFYSGEEFLEDYTPGGYDLILLDILGTLGENLINRRVLLKLREGMADGTDMLCWDNLVSR